MKVFDRMRRIAVVSGVCIIASAAWSAPFTLTGGSRMAEACDDCAFLESSHYGYLSDSDWWAIGAYDFYEHADSIWDGWDAEFEYWEGEAGCSYELCDPYTQSEIDDHMAAYEAPAWSAFYAGCDYENNSDEMYNASQQQLEVAIMENCPWASGVPTYIPVVDHCN